jgi:hypothetical protein
MSSIKFDVLAVIAHTNIRFMRDRTFEITFARNQIFAFVAAAKIEGDVPFDTPLQRRQMKILRISPSMITRT